MTPGASPSPRHVIVAGGGVAALEAVLALRALAGRIPRITVLTRAERYVQRPASVAEPFGFAAPEPVELAGFAGRQGVELRAAELERVDVEGARAILDDGRALAYDHLLVATGARPAPAVAGAITFRGPGDVSAIERLLDDARAGRARRVAFVVPPTTTWPLPLYELAIMTATELRSAGVAGVELTVVTPEPAPLALFGASAGAALTTALALRGIHLRAGRQVTRWDGQALHCRDGDTLACDAAVALPALVGPRVRGLPMDEDGFIPVDGHGRVEGCPGVYAAGDATDCPVKQGGLATQQADAAAEAIAAALGVLDGPVPFRPVLRGMLLTGGAPLYLRAELDGSRPPVAGRLAGAPGTVVGEAASRPLWWPPGKIAGRYLAPFLSDARPVHPAAEPLVDRVPPRATEPADATDPHAEAVELALALADQDAHFGDYRQALRALDAAAALTGGTLPRPYAAKRARWRELTGRPLART